ncbi:MAG: phage resistance protein, partial [Actinomycetota bacterium]|nr:phage resistance protein [Actinomycetota bacterium]
EALYLHGSFGAGKSHFMAVLHLLLQGHPAARAKPELHPAIAKHDPALAGKRFLLVPVHFLDARSMEQKILGGYVERVSAVAPDAPVPAVFLGDAIVAAELPGLRAKLGDDAFLAGLNDTGGGDDDWGDFASTWTVASLEAAIAAPATSEQRQSLVAAYIATYRQGTASEALATGEGYIDLSRGLAAISAHAQSLGYDAIVLFLDELILWLASTIGDLDFVQRESQKLTNLVEGSAANRPIPIISFVARQRDLRELVGDHIVGAERVSFADTLTLQSGRFGEIVLEAGNLPVVAKRRLLQPVSDAADQQLRDAVDQALRGRDDVRSVLLGSEADLELFRTVYPFSPTLVRALIDVAEALQRERTALKVMLQLLVDRRDQLQLGEIIPVGDLWDVVAARDEPLAKELRSLFATAKRLYRTRLRPMLLAEHSLSDDVDAGDPRWKAFQGDDRLLKTLLLAGLVPEVDAFRNLDAARLAALNWGSIQSPIPHRETQVVVTKLNRWNSQVGELKVGDDPVNPTVSLMLVDVDSESVVAAARESYDRLGDRRRALRELIDAMLDNRLGTDLTTTYKLVWRGTDRAVDISFGNIRDRGEVADIALRAGGGRPKVFIDFPFDELGHTPEEDLERLDTWDDRNEATATVCWLPSFFNNEGLGGLGRYVALSELMRSEQRFEQHTQHLSQRQRLELRPVLTSMRDQLRAQLRDAVLVAYGVRSGAHPWVDDASSLADHFRSLDPALVVRPTTSPAMAGALDELCDQMLTAQLPGHPRFDAKVTPGALRTTWDEVRRALADPDGRINVETMNRPALRNVATALGIGQMGDSHFVLSRDWSNRVFDRRLDAARNDGRTATVSDARLWIDEADGGPRGLPPEIADLIVLTVAAQCDHSLTQSGLAVTPTPGRPLAGDIVLRPELLPDVDSWRRAVATAGAVFGSAAGAHVSGPEVGAFGDDVAAKVAVLQDGAARLVDAVDAAYRRRGLDDGDRRRTARAARQLVRDLQGKSGHDAVTRLAAFEAPTSAAAVGTSLRSAMEVTRSLSDTNWALLEAAAAVVGDRVAEALAADEIARAWDLTRRDLEAEATRALAPRPDPAAPEPSRPPVPGDRAGGRVVRDVAGLDAALAEIRAALDALGSVDVSWRAPGPPA